MNEVSSARPRALVWSILLVLALMSAGTWRLWQSLAMQPGIDYYQLWGIAKCQRASNYQLGSPYLDPSAYQDQFWMLASASQDERLAAAIYNRQQPDPTGSPLIYYLMGSLPGPYAASLQVYRAAELAVFITVAFFLARRALNSRLVAALSALVLAAAFAPLLYELAVANVNCLQLLGLVLVATTLARNRAAVPAPTALACGILSGILVLLSLVKPNFDSATALLWLCLLCNGWERRWTILLVSAASTLMLYALPCMLFHSWSVWTDWWHYTFSSVARIAYPVAAGNYAAVRLLSQWLSLPVPAALAVMLGAMLISAWMVLRIPSTTAAGAGRNRASALPIVLKDPWLCLSLGTIVALALAPLVWEHYQVLAIVPALWLAATPGPAGHARAAGWLSLPLLADLPENLNGWISIAPLWLVQLNHALSWVPLWLGFLLVLQQRLRQVVP